MLEIHYGLLFHAEARNIYVVIRSVYVVQVDVRNYVDKIYNQGENATVLATITRHRLKKTTVLGNALPNGKKRSARMVYTTKTCLRYSPSTSKRVA